MASTLRLIPLRHRLPNPPPVFVGRDDDASRLRDAIERSTATVVCGIGGLGKTALVLHTMRRFFEREVDRAVMVRVTPGQGAKGALNEVVRALATVFGLAQVEWARLQADREAAIAAAIDLAEDAGVWVVLDDAHHVDAATLAALLGSVARYARNTRWIATSRETPALEDLSEQVLALGAMATGDLRSLAERCAPNLDAASLDRIAASSHGSPWRLRQALPGSVLPPRDDVVAGVDERALDVLRALAVLEAPVPMEVLAHMTTASEPRVLDSLERRGFIERTVGGARLHDVARPILQSRFAADREAWANRAAKALGSLANEDGTTTLERLRLHLGEGQVREALALLDASYDALRVAGFLPSLSQLLLVAESPELERFRMRAAVDAGDLEGASTLCEPASRSAEDRLLWARVMMLRGNYLEAADVARAALVDATDETKIELGLLEAKCAVTIGDVGRARARLEALHPKSEDQRAERDIALANVILKKGDDFVGALALATSVAHRHASLGPNARREVGEALVDHFIRSGHLRDAMDAYRTYAEREGGDAPRVHISLGDLVTQTTLAVQSGDLAETAALLTKFASFAPRSPFLRSHLLRIDIKRRLTAGELEGIEEAIDDFARQAVADGNADAYCVSRSYRAWVAQLRATPFPNDSVMPLTSMTQALIVEMGRQASAVRRGESVPWLTTPPPEVFPAQLKAIALALAAQNALLLGDEKTTLHLAGEAGRLALAHGWGPHEADVECIVCDAAIVFDRDDVLARAAERLDALARRFPSPRYAGDARFARAVLARETPDPAVLEELAVMVDVAPVAARRAQALLGGEPLLDSIDHSVIDAVRRRAGRFCVESSTTTTWRRGWGMDDSRTAVWTPERGLVSFAAKPLFWRVLSTIADAGGRAAKDELAAKAWNARDYHPLRDDKRMQVAMHKLRALIEVDPKRPVRIVTTPDGYAFGDSEPMRRVRGGTARISGR